MASEERIERGQQDAQSQRLVEAVGRAWRPRKLHRCTIRRIMVQARVALQQRPQPPVRKSEVIRQWSCISAQTLWRVIGQNDGLGYIANWSVRRGLVGGVMVDWIYTTNIILIVLSHII